MQDLGIIYIVRENLNIPMHASTQMSCNNTHSVKLLEKLGIERVVLARETSIENIKEIRKNTNIELETFIHGALCVSFSGQCAYSYLHGGRSANRGACALAKKPKILILDEPTSGLDGANMLKIKKMLADFTSQGGIAIIITHDLELMDKDYNYLHLTHS